MNPAFPPAGPLVSVIIPCYNHGAYLPEALASVRQQAYPAVEIVVVDDGSTDDTQQVAQACPGVRYVYQPNQGLSAARNAGVAHSTGPYLVFLDADDWLLPNALATNAGYLRQSPALAFVSGGHDKVYEATGRTRPETREVGENHYVHLLQGNYIGMHGAVMYRRWVFERFQYDPALRACEDYDLYLRIARAHPVAHHPQPVAAYRLRAASMSGNTSLMLSTVLTVLHRQQPYLQNAAEEYAYALGQRNWAAYYLPPLPPPLAGAGAPVAPAKLPTPPSPPASMLKKLIKRHAPAAGLRLLHKAGVYPGFRPAVGQVALGDLARLQPFSTEFGYDRGGPIDRYYIEDFLRREADSICGRVLEIGDNAYTLQFGGDRVGQSDVLHVDAGNPQATFVGDLSDAPHLPTDAFDCLVLTQTLHLIYDFQGALRTCFRILKPGGVLLLTTPGITPIDGGEWGETWYWSFTAQALRRLLADTFPAASVEIGSHGNVHVAAAYLYGMGLPEIDPRALAYYDPQYQVINTVRAVKPGAGAPAGA